MTAPWPRECAECAITLESDDDYEWVDVTEDGSPPNRTDEVAVCPRCGNTGFKVEP